MPTTIDVALQRQWADDIREQSKRVTAAYTKLHDEDPPDVKAAKLNALRREWVKYRALIVEVLRAFPDSHERTDELQEAIDTDPIGVWYCRDAWGKEVGSPA